MTELKTRSDFYKGNLTDKEVDKINLKHITKYIDEDAHVKELDDGSWHIGQSYQKETVNSLVCRSCGSKDFNVGQGDYYTAIRCTHCMYELMVHDG